MENSKEKSDTEALLYDITVRLAALENTLLESGVIKREDLNVQILTCLQKLEEAIKANAAGGEN